MVLKADSHKLRLTYATVAKGCVQKNRKFPISAVAMQPSAAAAFGKRGLSELAFIYK